MEIIFLSVIIAYVIYITQLTLGFDKIKTYSTTEKLKPTTAFTIIVPYRNEAKNLPKLLRSLSKLNYPQELIEIIMVDDDSKDNSSSIFIQWRMKNDQIDTTLLENLRLTNSPKKDAIARAMPIAKNNWIITTDADCVVKPNWLLTFDHFIQNNDVEMIAAPVKYKTKNNWIHYFQQLDLLSLQATTIGSFGISKPFMCNGANFGFTKKLFSDLNGYFGNSSIASGDDVFLLQKALNKNPDKVRFLKNTNAIVTTKPENDLFKLFMQRVRWASKTNSYIFLYPKILALIVFTTNALVVYGFTASLLNHIDYRIFLGFFVIKYGVDFYLLLKVQKFISPKSILYPVSSSIIYPFFVTSVGIYSLFGNFTWKGRRFKK